MSPFGNESIIAILTTGAPYMALGAILFALTAIIIGWTAHRRVRKLYIGKHESVEEILKELLRRSREMQVFREDTEQYLSKAEQRISRSVRGVGVVRFNPFQGDGSGGNQSFSTAFLDEHNNGVVFSALYARTGASSTYAKPIENGASPFELTEEEIEAVRIASEKSRPEFGVVVQKVKKEG